MMLNYLKELLLLPTSCVYKKTLTNQGRAEGGFQGFQETPIDDFVKV